MFRLVCFVALLTPAAAIASGTAAPAKADPATSKAANEKMVCERILISGSNIPKKICVPKRESDTAHKAARDDGKDGQQRP